MIIRQEQTTDYPKIYNLVKIAFETAPVKDGDEQEYVNGLRASNKYISELALVAEESKLLIGHIMLTKLEIAGSVQSFQELLLSPICVEFSNRNQGVGTALIEESFRIATKMGYAAVFVLGDPSYYSRFGFVPTSDFSITNDGNIPQKYIMARELFSGALKNKNGKIKLV